MDGSDEIIEPDGRRVSLRVALAESSDAVFRFLRKMSGDPEKARDLAQEVMVKAILRFRTFRGRSSFRTWLLSIAVNLYRDEQRRRRPLRLPDDERVHDDGREELQTLRRLDAQRAASLVRTLKAGKRAALLLRFESGLSYEEIARVLSCPVGTVRSRLHGAITDLRVAMGVGHG